MTDTSAVDAAIEAVIAAHPDKVEELKTKPKLAAWFVGQVMRQTDGEANPLSVYTALKQKLNFPEDR
jgi:aspartyl-tRNA(Asn)/glutamyl-tRNA(Gln) amidotransferase subunit B